MPVVATALRHPAAATEEAEIGGFVGTAPVGRGVPIVAVPTNVVTRRPVAVARSRKKDTITIGSRYFITVYTTLGGPCPSTFIYEFFHLSSGR